MNLAGTSTFFTRRSFLRRSVAALATVLSGLTANGGDPGPQEYNPWGHPVDKLRYALTSWQRVTLLERTHLRR